jgi:hypothetical protein
VRVKQLIYKYDKNNDHFIDIDKELKPVLTDKYKNATTFSKHVLSTRWIDVGGCPIYEITICVGYYFEYDGKFVVRHEYS